MVLKTSFETSLLGLPSVPVTVFLMASIIIKLPPIRVVGVLQVAKGCLLLRLVNKLDDHTEEHYF